MIIHPILKLYIILLEDFYNLKISPLAFHDDYMKLWKKDRDNSKLDIEPNRKSLSSEIRDILDRIFTTLDCYCPDPELRGEHDLDDEQMRKEILALYEELKQLLKKQKN